MKPATAASQSRRGLDKATAWLHLSSAPLKQPGRSILAEVPSSMKLLFDFPLLNSRHQKNGAPPSELLTAAPTSVWFLLWSISTLLLFFIKISENASDGFTYFDWHPSRRPVIRVRVEAWTPQLGAKVSANSESAGFLAFGPPTAPQSPWYALMYWRAMHASPWLLYKDGSLLAVLLLLTVATSSSAGLSVTLSAFFYHKKRRWTRVHGSRKLHFTWIFIFEPRIWSCVLFALVLKLDCNTKIMATITIWFGDYTEERQI